VAEGEKLKRERAGTYRTTDGRFTVEQSTTGWLLLDGEQTNELGLPLARGPFDTLDSARAALADARSGPRPISDLAGRRAARDARAKGSASTADRGAAGTDTRPAAEKPAGSRAGKVRRAPARATGHELVIREMRASDGDSLRALWQSVGFRSVGDDDRSLARMARRNPGLLLVATEGTRIVGSALGGWDGRRGWLYHVATAESHRRRGIATRLVDQLETSLRALGCPKVNALVRDESDGGRAFWEARGYTPGGARQLGRELGGD
jgi:ribosomal protein S18 acetylase RimI-like enzyme